MLPACRADPAPGPTSDPPPRAKATLLLLAARPRRPLLFQRRTTTSLPASPHRIDLSTRRGSIPTTPHPWAGSPAHAMPKLLPVELPLPHTAVVPPFSVKKGPQSLPQWEKGVGAQYSWHPRWPAARWMGPRMHLNRRVEIQPLGLVVLGPAAPVCH